jgi:hypothetical protein
MDLNCGQIVVHHAVLSGVGNELTQEPKIWDMALSSHDHRIETLKVQILGLLMRWLTTDRTLAC